MIVRRIRYGFLILLALLLLLFYHDYFFMLLFAAVISLPVFSYFSWKSVLANCDIRVVVPDSSVEEGKKVKIKFRIQNDSMIPIPNVVISFRMENAFYPNSEVHYMKLPVHAHSVREYEWKVTSLYAGKIAIHVTEFSMCDMLGIFSKTKTFDERYQVLVLPKVVPLSSQYEERLNRVKQEWEQHQSAYASDNPAEIADIRELRPGDRLQKIHWKLSTKTDMFYVKEYEKEEDTALTLYLELHREAEEMGYFNAMITVFYSSCRWLLTGGIPFYVQWYNVQLQKTVVQFVTNEQHLLDMLAQFYEMQPYDSGYPAYEALQSENAQRRGGVYYFAPVSFPYVQECEVLECYENKVMVLWVKEK